MRITNKSMIKMITVIMVMFSLFTLMQAYYSAYLQMVLLVVCFFACREAQGKTVLFLLSSFIFFVVLFLIDSIKGIGSFMSNLGLFLHYITWPLLFVCVTQMFTVKEIKWLLYFIVAICIIGDILSLIQLGINPEISRLLAGQIEGAEKIYYYKKGVGGYGYVFAMAFFNFGVVRMLRTVKTIPERVYLLSFLVLNCIFILYASYTTAIVLTILLITVASISEVRHKYRTVFLAAFMALIVVYFRDLILDFAYNFAHRLNLDWVALRFEQLLRVEQGEEADSLRRVMLYRRSWNTFLSNPFFGGRVGAAISGHSQMLDSLARYGLMSSLLVWFFVNCRNLCGKILGKDNLMVFFLSFFVFICVDTCTVMQIPVAVFFAVPLIAYLEKGEEQR